MTVRRPAISPIRACLRAAFVTLTVLALPAGIVTTLAYFISEGVILSQLSPFRLQYAVLLAAHAALCLGLRHTRWAVVFSLFALFNLGAVLTPHFSRSVHASADSDAAALRILYANVLTENETPEALFALIAAEAPDLIALLEVNGRWREQLVAKLTRDYPHRFIRDREDNFGIALFSRRPLLDPRVEYFTASEVPSLAVTLPDGGANLLLTHPLPPGDALNTRLRDEHLDALAEWSQSAMRSARVIIIGDLNATAWCPPLRRLAARSDLRFAGTRHRFFAATWPVHVPHLRIPIDHVLLDRRLGCSAFRVGPDIGSDHFPLLVDITPAP